MDSPIRGYPTIGDYKRDIVQDYINYGSEVKNKSLLQIP